MMSRARPTSRGHATSDKLLYLLAGLLACSGCGIAAYKAHLGFPLTPKSGDRVWNLEVSVKFSAGRGPVKVSMFIPRSSRGFALMHDEFISEGYELTARAEGGNRKVTWSKPDARGEQTLYYRAVVR